MIAIVGLVFETWAAAVLWGWSLTKAFGIPVPTFAVMFVLNCLVSLLTGRLGPKQKLSRTDEVARAVGFCLYRPALVLLLAWLATKIC